MYGRPVRLHVVLARELLLAYVALKLWRQVAARQLVALQVAAALEKLQTLGAAVLGSHATLFGQVKAQVRLALVVSAAVRAHPSVTYTRPNNHKDVIIIIYIYVTPLRGVLRISDKCNNFYSVVSLYIKKQKILVIICIMY